MLFICSNDIQSIWEVEYSSFTPWRTSNLKVLVVSHDENKNVFITPGKIKEEVAGFNYDFELSQEVLKLRHRQIVNRLKVVHNLGSVKGEDYLRRVMNFKINSNIDSHIQDMENELKDLNQLIKNLEFIERNISWSVVAH